MPYSTHRTLWLLLLGLATLPLQAQVSEPTEADKANVPLPFRPDDQKQGQAISFAPHGTPPGYTPNSDPRDFSGSYVTNGGPPPGGPPPGAAGTGAPPPPPPRATCVPSFDYGAYAIHIVSSAHRLTIVGEENHRVRRIYIDEAPDSTAAPAYSGHSTGRWNGDTLVIDTIGIKGRPDTHLRERWRREQNGSIAIESATVTATGAEQAATHSEMIWRPDLKFVENICEDFGEAFGPGYSAGKKP